MQLSIYGFPSTEGLFQMKKQAVPERQLSYDITPNKYSQAILSGFFKFFLEIFRKFLFVVFQNKSAGNRAI